MTSRRHTLSGYPFGRGCRRAPPMQRLRRAEGAMRNPQAGSLALRQAAAHSHAREARPKARNPIATQVGALPTVPGVGTARQRYSTARGFGGTASPRRKRAKLLLPKGRRSLGRFRVTARLMKRVEDPAPRSRKRGSPSASRAFRASSGTAPRARSMTEGAQPNREPGAGTARQRHSPTRAQQDRRHATQSRVGCGHCPPHCLHLRKMGYNRDRGLPQ